MVSDFLWLLSDLKIKLELSPCPPIKFSIKPE